MRRWDFIVVGGGAAGLAAAAALGDSGARVLLLEARRRLGGRIWTQRPAGWPGPVELGAEFVHGRSPAIVRIVRESGLLLGRIPDVHLESRGGRLRDMGNVWRRFDALTRRLRDRGPDRSIAEFLDTHRLAPRDRRLLASMIEGYDAAPLERASEKAVSTRGNPPSSPSEHAQLRILSGYDGVIAHLERLARSFACRIERSAVVREVRWRRGRVEIEVDSGRRFHAHRAVVTVPAGVLKARPGARGAIRFDPEPESLRRALSGIEMGDVVRLVLRFREAFWRPALEDREDAAFLHAGSPFPTLWTAAPLDLPMLTLWAGGPAATALRSGGRRRVLEEAFRTLSTLFHVSPDRAKRLLVGVHWHDWSADPFTRGAYSYVTVGGASAPGRLARPVGGTLFFAGEAASSQESGTVPAAIQSGRRAARRALAGS